MKFEKVMKKFSKNIGIDHKVLLSMLLGNQADDNSSSKEPQNSHKEPQSAQKENLSEKINKEIEPLNTGVAAQLAYNNISMGVIENDVANP